jgi:large subunit ribosomal protein L37Ae
MSERSGRTGSAGRFGARYGRVARRRVAEIEAGMREDHTCPDCGDDRVERDGTGIWTCDACGHSFTGGAYQPETPGGKTVRRSIRAALSEDEDVAVEVDEDVAAEAGIDADAEAEQ